MQIVVFDPLKLYCADRLLFPTPTPRVTPPREALGALREALHVGVLPVSCHGGSAEVTSTVINPQFWSW